MCLAVYKPAGLDIPRQNLKNAYDSNNDGCGLCWAEDGQLHIKKGMMKFDDFYTEYQEHKQCNMLIHFRKSTHGKKDENNCHPFIFNDGQLALIHNGVIPIKCNEDGYSDTWHFVNKVLDPMVKQHHVPIDDQALSWFIRVSIGSDKIAVMDTKGEVVIFNEEKGNWEDTETIGDATKKGKVWYSNYSFRNLKSTTTYPNTGYCGGNSTNNSYGGSTTGGNNRNDNDNVEEWNGYGYHQNRLTDGSTKPLEIADDKTRGPGKMTEYGWYDAEIEGEIESAKKTTGMSREDALIHVFNNA